MAQYEAEHKQERRQSGDPIWKSRPVTVQHGSPAEAHAETAAQAAAIRSVSEAAVSLEIVAKPERSVEGDAIGALKRAPVGRHRKSFVGLQPRHPRHGKSHGRAIERPDRKSTRLNSSHIPLSRMPS